MNIDLNPPPARRLGIRERLPQRDTFPTVVRRLSALLPFLVLLIAAALYALDIRAVFEPPLLLPILNTIFISLVSFLVAYLAASAYLASYRLGLLFLGAGTVSFGASGLIAGWGADLPGGLNFGVTVFNTGALFAGALHLVAAAFITFDAISPGGAAGAVRRLVSVYFLIAALTIGFIAAALFGLVPTFFVASTGPTLLRQLVLLTSVALFTAAGLLLWRHYLLYGSTFLLLYALALAFIAVGLITAIPTRELGSPLSWAGRIAQYLGSISYFVAVLTAAQAARLRGLPIERVLGEFFGGAETNYQDLVETSPDPVVAIDQNGRILLWNSAAEQVFGYTRPKAIGQKLPSLLRPREGGGLLIQAMEKGMASGRDRYIERGLESLIRTADNRVLPSEFSISLRKSPSGWVATYIIRDISDRRQMEEDREDLYEREQSARAAAEQARNRLAFLAEANARLSASLDYDSTLQTLAEIVVPALAEVCLIDTLDEAGEFHRALVHPAQSSAGSAAEFCKLFPLDPAHNPEYFEALRESRSFVKVNITEQDLARASHSPEELEQLKSLGPGSFMLIPLASRQRIGAMIMLRSKSERAYNTEDLTLASELCQRASVAIENARLYEEARNAVQLRDQFISIASHELRTPLTTALGYAELLNQRLAHRSDLGPDERRMLETIAVQTIRLNKMIAGLLDISRLERGQLTLDKEPLDLGPFIQHIVQEIRPTLRRHTLSVEKPSEPVVVLADALRLQQVLENLIQNGIKYSPLGGPILVELGRTDGQAQISISDRGIGIPAASINNLFKRFYRAPNAEAYHISGLGVGLYVVRDIARLHGGDVTVASQEGEGSRFTLTLPLAPAEQ